MDIFDFVHSGRTWWCLNLMTHLVSLKWELHVVRHNNRIRRGWGNRAAVGRGGAPIICSINDRVTNTNLCGRQNGRFRWLITLNVLKFAYERDTVCLQIPLNHVIIRAISLIYQSCCQLASDLATAEQCMSKHGSNWTHLTHFVSKMICLHEHYIKTPCQ